MRWRILWTLHLETTNCNIPPHTVVNGKKIKSKELAKACIKKSVDGLELHHSDTHADGKR